MFSADFISGSHDYAKFNFRCADFDSFSGVHLTLGARGFFLVGGDRIERQSREGESRSGEKADKHYSL